MKTLETLGVFLLVLVLGALGALLLPVVIFTRAGAWSISELHDLWIESQK